MRYFHINLKKYVSLSRTISALYHLSHYSQSHTLIYELYVIMFCCITMILSGTATPVKACFTWCDLVHFDRIEQLSSTLFILHFRNMFPIFTPVLHAVILRQCIRDFKQWVFRYYPWKRHRTKMVQRDRVFQSVWWPSRCYIAKQEKNALCIKNSWSRRETLQCCGILNTYLNIRSALIRLVCIRWRNSVDM